MRWRLRALLDAAGGPFNLALMALVAGVVVFGAYISVTRGHGGPFAHRFARVIGPLAPPADGTDLVWAARGFGADQFQVVTPPDQILQVNQLVCLRYLRPAVTADNMVPLGRDLRRAAVPVDPAQCRGAAPPAP